MKRATEAYLLGPGHGTCTVPAPLAQCVGEHRYAYPDEGFADPADTGPAVCPGD